MCGEDTAQGPAARGNTVRESLGRRLGRRSCCREAGGSQCEGETGAGREAPLSWRRSAPAPSPPPPDASFHVPQPCLPQVTQEAPLTVPCGRGRFPEPCASSERPVRGHISGLLRRGKAHPPIHKNSPYAALSSLVFFSFSFKQRYLMKTRFLFPLLCIGAADCEWGRVGLPRWS